MGKLKMKEGAVGPSEEINCPMVRASSFPDKKPENNFTLLPGGLLCGSGPAVVTMVLGSCVCVTMICRRPSLWGICHAVLPKGIEDNPAGCCRYVDESIRRMSDWFERHGAQGAEIEVKLFGGAEIMTGNSHTGRYVPVGRANVRTALETLESIKLRVLTSDVGGYTGRKIRFSASTGNVMVKRLRGSAE